MHMFRFDFLDNQVHNSKTVSHNVNARITISTNTDLGHFYIVF